MPRLHAYVCDDDVDDVDFVVCSRIAKEVMKRKPKIKDLRYSECDVAMQYISK